MKIVKLHKLCDEKQQKLLHNREISRIRNYTKRMAMLVITYIGKIIYKVTIILQFGNKTVKVFKKY
ncbi:MAG: hypothetical protein FWG70_04755 [Oscillospiraceae bacterium]|nr:hypothetical protein [Oscillospiraceae bacterium]